MVTYTKTLFLTNPYLASLTYYPCAFTFKACLPNLPHTWSAYKGNIPSNLNHKICIKCHNPDTPLYCKCEGHASLVSMQPTDKHLRISYVHEVNNNMTQLLSMSYNFMFHQMHSSISKYNTHCKMTNGCSNMFLSHDWVTPSRILLLLIIPRFLHLPHISTSPVGTPRINSPCVCMNDRREAQFRVKGLLWSSYPQ
jgi:hypothetical protein